MKYLIWIFTSLFHMASPGQNPPDGTNQIIVETDASFEEVYRALGKSLIKEGYVLESAERDFGIIVTAPYGFEYDKVFPLTAKAKFYLEITSKDDKTEVLINGKVYAEEYYKRGGVDSSFDTDADIIKVKGRENQIFMTSWKLMAGIAGLVPDGTIYAVTNPDLK